MSSNASPSKRKPTKKKQITTKSSSKSSDIRAATNRCGNYIPTRICSILDKLSQAHKKEKKICYFCQYSLYNNCFILQRKSRRNNIECLAGWLDEPPQLPDIDLINNFNYELLLQYANSTSDSGFSSGNENNNSIQKDKKVNEITNHLQVKEFFENHSSVIENNIFIRNKNNVDDNVNIGDIQDKQNFVVEEEHDKDPKTKKTLEYFGLNCIEDMFTGSDDEEAYQSDSTIIYSPNYPTKKVKSVNVISDNESDLEINTDTCNYRKSLRKRHMNESDNEGPVYKSKKSGHQQIKRNTASSASSSTSTSTHAAYKNKASDVQTRAKRDNQYDDKDTAYESDNISVFETDTDSDSDSSTDINTYSKLQRERNNDSNNKCLDNESVDKIINTIIANFTSNKTITLPFDANDNDVQVIEKNVPCIFISDTDSDSENNTDININSKLPRERNNDANNECLDVESVNKGINTNIASFTSNETITSPFDDNDNDVQVIETNVPCIFISDTDSDSENNTDINTNSKLQREQNIDSNNERLDNESVDKIINTIIANFTSNKTITLSFDANDNDVQVIEKNVPCIFISDTDSDSENNTDININSKLPRERNNDANNECLDVESVNKGINTNIASFTSNETIALPFDDNDNDIQIIETNVPCIIISDTVSGNNPEADDVSASNKVKETCVITDSDSDLDDGWLDQYLRY